MALRIKSVFAVLLILGGLTLSGCQTTKGAAEGVGMTADGTVKDTQSLWGAITSFDAWLRKNAW